MSTILLVNENKMAYLYSEKNFAAVVPFDDFKTAKSESGRFQINISYLKAPCGVFAVDEFFVVDDDEEKRQLAGEIFEHGKVVSVIKEEF